MMGDSPSHSHHQHMNASSDPREETYCINLNRNIGAPFVDRPMPDLLSYHMSNSEWISFCEELDKARVSAKDDPPFYFAKILLYFFGKCIALTVLPFFFLFGNEVAKWLGILNEISLFGIRLYTDNLRRALPNNFFMDVMCILSNQNAKSSNIFFYWNRNMKGHQWITCSTTKRSVKRTGMWHTDIGS
jgi:hypothetical protein